MVLEEKKRMNENTGMRSNQPINQSINQSLNQEGHRLNGSF